MHSDTEYLLWNRWRSLKVSPPVSFLARSSTPADLSSLPITCSSPSSLATEPSSTRWNSNSRSHERSPTLTRKRSYNRLRDSEIFSRRSGEISRCLLSSLGRETRPSLRLSSSESRNRNRIPRRGSCRSFGPQEVSQFLAASRETRQLADVPLRFLSDTSLVNTGRYHFDDFLALSQDERSVFFVSDLSLLDLEEPR